MHWSLATLDGKQNMWYILFLNVIVRDPSSEREKGTSGEKRGAVCGVGGSVVGVGRAVKTGRPRAAGLGA